MARVLYWNVRKFTDRRINSLKGGPSRGDGEYAAAPGGHQVLDAMLSTLTRTRDGDAPIQLDFVIIVEVSGTAGNPDEGDLVGGEARAGCLNLLAAIRNHLPGGQQWMLVPPVVTGARGKREAVAVYYRADRWHFLGPLSWSGAYPAAFNNTLPAGNIPPAYPFRGGQPFNRGTGQRVFNNFQGTGPVLFPAATDRKPWLTTFGAVGDPTTLVRLFTVHTSPSTPTSRRVAEVATRNLAQTKSIRARPPDAANQIDVIAGDFNIDNTADDNFAADGPYGPLLNLVEPFTPLVRPPAGMLDHYNTYYHTMGRRTAGTGLAQIVDGKGQPAGDYPGLSYTSQSVDNIFVRYRGGANPPAAHNTTILSRARTTPYRAPAGPPAVKPMLGYFSARTRMEATITQLLALAAAGHQPNINKQFRDWNNYGRLYGMSDHFPIVFDI